MPEPPPIGTRIRRWIIRGVLKLTLFVLLYVLSIGPMFWYWYEAMYIGGSSFILAFYQPLLVACEKNEFIHDVVNGYIDLWIL